MNRTQMWRERGAPLNLGRFDEMPHPPRTPGISTPVAVTAGVVGRSLFVPALPFVGLG